MDCIWTPEKETNQFCPTLNQSYTRSLITFRKVWFLYNFLRHTYPNTGALIFISFEPTGGVTRLCYNSICILLTLSWNAMSTYWFYILYNVLHLLLALELKVSASNQAPHLAGLCVVETPVLTKKLSSLPPILKESVYEGLRMTTLGT